jgi:acetyl esterase/lipase
MITPSKKVIDFLKIHAPGEWPSQSSDENYQIYTETVTAGNQFSNHIIYLIHGGAYCLGSAQIYRTFSYMYSKNSGSPVFGIYKIYIAINYRLAPQNPYPCGLIDVVSGYLHLLTNYRASSIVMIGDSAGGGLMSAALFVLRDMVLPMPAGMVGLSPWVDLSHSFPSFHENNLIDYIPSMKDKALGTRLHYYTANDFLLYPYVSPLWAKNFNDLPPFLIQVGGTEKLFDEVLEFAHKLVNAPFNPPVVTLEVYEAHVHVFQAITFCNASKLAIKRITDWIDDVIGGKSTLVSKRIDYTFNGDLISKTVFK